MSRDFPIISPPYEELVDTDISELYQELLLVSAGARFFKADLHVHTPASKDYREKQFGGDPLKDLRYLHILERSKELGLDLIAITDHNTIEGYEKIRELLRAKSTREQFRNLGILFGVEITVEAGRYVHLTTFFDEQTPLDDVERLLVRIGIDKPGDEHDWAKSIKLDQLIKLITDMGGLAVPAHVDSSAGILEEMKRGLPLARILTMPEVAAIGITKTKTIEYLERLFREDLNFQRTQPMAYVMGSDAHALSKISSVTKSGEIEIVDRGLGNLVTYMKMDAPNFAGFKYAIQEPSKRIRLTSPQPAFHPRIIGMAILGGYLGKGNNWNYFRFNEELNCIVGGRGTGKSTVLRVLQVLSLAISGHQPNDWHSAVEYAFDKACLFVDLGHGQIRAVAASTKPSPNFVVLMMNESCSFVPVEPIDIQSWNPDLFGQKQIQAITNSPLAQRDLHDSFCARVAPERFAATLGKYTSLKEQLESLYSTISQDARAIGDAKYQIFNASRVLRRIRRLSSATLSEVAKEIDDWEAEAQIPRFVASLLQEDSSSEVKELLSDLRQVKRQMRSGISQGEGSISEEDIHLYLRSLQKLATIAPLESLCLQTRRVNGDSIRDSFLSLYETFENFKECIINLREARNELFHIRKSVADFLSDQLGGKVRIVVVEMGDTGTWGEYVLERLKGHSQKGAIDSRTTSEVVNHIGTPYEALLAALEKYHPFDKLTEVFPDDAKEELYLTLLREMKSTFIKRLHESERDLSDAILIYLADQEIFKPIEQLSLGQRCVAILEIVLLTASNVPVVIDQPEDDLDNSYVFSELVQTLRKTKEQRQLILVTHNPNIPIGGDADQVFVMKSDGAKAWIEQSGSVDNTSVRAHLLQTLEGGRQAFELRRTRYHAIA